MEPNCSQQNKDIRTWCEEAAQCYSDHVIQLLPTCGVCVCTTPQAGCASQWPLGNHTGDTAMDGDGYQIPQQRMY